MRAIKQRETALGPALRNGRAVRPAWDPLPARDVDGAYGSASNWDGETVNQFTTILWRRKWTVVSIMALCIAAAILITRAQTPVYRAKAKIEIQNLNEDFLNIRSVTP